MNRFLDRDNQIIRYRELTSQVRDLLEAAESALDEADTLNRWGTNHAGIPETIKDAALQAAADAVNELSNAMPF